MSDWVMLAGGGRRAVIPGGECRREARKIRTRRRWRTPTGGRVYRSGRLLFRATGITQYLRNGGRRELAQQMAAHESPRTTALDDRRDDEVAVD